MAGKTYLVAGHSDWIMQTSAFRAILLKGLHNQLRSLSRAFSYININTACVDMFCNYFYPTGWVGSLGLSLFVGLFNVGPFTAKIWTDLKLDHLDLLSSWHNVAPTAILYEKTLRQKQLTRWYIRPCAAHQILSMHSDFVRNAFRFWLLNGDVLEITLISPSKLAFCSTSYNKQPQFCMKHILTKKFCCCIQICNQVYPPKVKEVSPHIWPIIPIWYPFTHPNNHWRSEV